jgi:hypothetical protein
MTWSPDSSITGGDQTGLTSPTYTVVDDVAPENNGKQKVVSALGGTQTNVRTHTTSDPFRWNFTKPKTPKALPTANPVTGIVPSVPKNTYGLLLHKGVKVNAAGQLSVMNIRLTIDVPAGAEAADAVNIRAAISLLVGLLNEESADLGDTLVLGVL